MVGRHAQQVRQRHRREQSVELLVRAVGELDALGARLRVHLDDLGVELLALGRQRRVDLLPDHAGAVERVAELRVGAPRRSVLALDDVGEDVVEADGRDALPHPDRVHLDGGVRPHLGVVRPHEGLGEALAEARHEPLVKVARRRVLGQHLLGREVLDDAHHLVLRQPPQVALHRVAHPLLAHQRGRVALVVEPVLWRQLVVEQRVEELEVREEAVDADVPRELGVVGHRAREARRRRRPLEQLPVGVAELGQPVRRAQPRRPRADDHDLRVVAERRRA